MKGVNRHESNPAVGHAITREMMEKEVMLMKRANINHVRNSHYPDDPYWYFLCNKYGIYLEDEANIESHEIIMVLLPCLIRLNGRRPCGARIGNGPCQYQQSGYRDLVVRKRGRPGR